MGAMEFELGECCIAALDIIVITRQRLAENDFQHRLHAGHVTEPKHPIPPNDSCSSGTITVICRIHKYAVNKESAMPAVARFDLTMNVEEKDVVSRAAALMGTTMAAFVRTAAKEKARELLDRESRITMTDQDFQAFTTALDEAFAPNAALQNAMTMARGIKRA